jgi:hypothetical protein
MFGSTTTSTSTTAPFENKSIQTDSLSLYDPLPTNKIEAMLRIHASDCSSDTTKVLLNAFTTVNKIDLESLWIVAIVPELYEKVPLQHKTICSLYIALLRELMFEHIQTPTQLYEWLIKFVENNALGAHLLATEVFGMLERWVLEHGDQPLGVGLLEDVFGAFVWALQTFIVYDNCPHLAFDAVRNSTNPIYKTFLRSFIGASYGWPTI